MKLCEHSGQVTSPSGMPARNNDMAQKAKNKS